MNIRPDWEATATLPPGTALLGPDLGVECFACGKRPASVYARLEYPNDPERNVSAWLCVACVLARAG